MCGRYSLICIDDLGNRFRVFDPMMGARSRFNVAPGNEMPVIVRSDRNHLAIMRWGLIPRWTKDIHAAKALINARAETLAEKPAFRVLLSTHRCLVPASGFFEWKKEGKKKIPYYIRLSGSPLFSFAGLYDQWRNPEGVTVSTYTIVTCDANHLVAPLHDRMPVILSPQGEDRWLDTCPLPHGEVKKILVPYPAGLMEAIPVSDRVNSPAVDDERLIQPLVSQSGTQRLLEG
ncbi:MAG: SOS response-associated peptidase [Methanoregula sp.]|nr:SOS response-associated peptidase [Methanoregula sp.]